MRSAGSTPGSPKSCGELRQAETVRPRLRGSVARASVGHPCGRYANDKIVDDLIQASAASGGDAQDWEPASRVPRRTRARIVRARLHNGEARHGVNLTSSGMRPSWAKDGGPAPINARIDTAPNGMSRSAHASARALVLNIGTVSGKRCRTASSPISSRPSRPLACRPRVWTSHGGRGDAVVHALHARGP